MIVIKKNKVNDIVCTLTEKSYYTNPNYLLKLVSNDNLEVKVVRMLSDTSLNVIRYNDFTLEENAVEDRENAIVSLEVGTYDYTFYETLTASGTTINYSTDRSLETGILKVDGGASTITTYTNRNTIKTYGE